MRVRGSVVKLAIYVGLFHVSPVMAGSLSAVPSTMVPIYLGNNIVGNMIGAAKRPGNDTSSSRGTSPSSPRPSSNDFSVRHDRNISAKARQAFIAGIVSSSGQKIADDFDRQIGDVQTTFTRAVSGYGLRSGDFSDVMTAYMIMTWMAANKQVALPKVSQVNGVRAQLRPTLAGKLGDAHQRQLVAETMMYQTCVLIAAREQAEQGNAQLLNAAAEAINKNGNGGGMRRLALTDQGLVAR